MKKIAKAAMVGAFLIWGANAAWAGAGLSGAQILQNDFGARPAGMAGAFTAMSGDIYSQGANPAGLADLSAAEILFMNLGGIDGISTQKLAGAAPVPGLGTLGAQVLYQGQPAIDNQVPGEAAVEVKNLLFGISYAHALGYGVQAGLNAKLTSLTLGPADTSAISLDLGAQYALDENTHFGLSVRNWGTPVKFYQVDDPLPLTESLGAAVSLPPSGGPHLLTGVIDLDYQVPEQNFVTRLGAEYWYKHLLALRIGYAYSSTKFVGGLCAGVGFRFKLGQVQMALDYALQPQSWEEGDFQVQNLISLGARF